MNPPDCDPRPDKDERSDDMPLHISAADFDLCHHNGGFVTCDKCKLKDICIDALPFED